MKVSIAVLCVLLTACAANPAKRLKYNEEGCVQAVQEGGYLVLDISKPVDKLYFQQDDSDVMYPIDTNCIAFDK